MPTPKRTNIPITMRDARLLTPVHRYNSTLIPRNIRVGGTETSAHRIWAQISTPVQPPDPGTHFHRDENVNLQAILPDLQRAVRNFDSSQSIIIQYPLGMDLAGFMWLEAMPIGSQGSFRWTVRHKPVIILCGRWTHILLLPYIL